MKREHQKNSQAMIEAVKDDISPKQYPHKGREGGLAYWIPWAIEQYKQELNLQEELLDG